MLTQPVTDSDCHYLDFVANFQFQQNGLASHGVFVVGLMILVVERGNFRTVHPVNIWFT